jgi:hypothetical protein
MGATTPATAQGMLRRGPRQSGISMAAKNTGMIRSMPRLRGSEMSAPRRWLRLSEVSS